jgi:hypothetical protein
MNYTTLQSEVASYLHRTDLAAKIPTFIELAEAYLFRELHIKEMQISVDGTTTAGYATLPTDFGSVSRVSVTYGGIARSLDYIALADAPTATSGAPAYYSLENNKLRIWGASDGQAYTLYYIPAIQNLSGLVTTNWLLENAPELYLDASCLQGAKYTRNDAEVAKLTGNVALSIDSVKRFSERRGQPATGSMQIKVRRG